MTKIPNIGALLLCGECGTGRYRPFNGNAKCDTCDSLYDTANAFRMAFPGERVVWVGGMLAVVKADKLEA